MQKQDLALNNQQWLIYRKTKLNQIKLVLSVWDKMISDILIDSGTNWSFQEDLSVTGGRQATQNHTFWENLTFFFMHSESYLSYDVLQT